MENLCLGKPSVPFVIIRIIDFYVKKKGSKSINSLDFFSIIHTLAHPIQ